MAHDQMEQHVTGTVVRAESGLFHVQVGDETIPSVLRGKLKKRWSMVTSLVVVGDLVTLVRTPDGGAAIETIHERRTKLSRPGFHGYEHVVAANLDQLVIVASVRQPPFRRHLIDRFLLHSRHCGLDPVVVVNKCDLEDDRVVRSWVDPLAFTGVPVLLTSTVTGQGLQEMANTLRGKVSVLAGQSGVGKSTLLNAICPDLQVRTGTVNRHARGAHTTTSSRLYPMPFGGWLVDTPGIKELSLWEADEAEVAHTFPEIEALSAGCKFRDCRHDREPRCAVKAAVASGALDGGRYKSYLKLTAGSR